MSGMVPSLPVWRSQGVQPLPSLLCRSQSWGKGVSGDVRTHGTRGLCKERLSPVGVVRARRRPERGSEVPTPDTSGEDGRAGVSLSSGPCGVCVHGPKATVVVGICPLKSAGCGVSLSVEQGASLLHGLSGESRLFLSHLNHLPLPGLHSDVEQAGLQGGDVSSGAGRAAPGPQLPRALTGWEPQGPV